MSIEVFRGELGRQNLTLGLLGPEFKSQLGTFLGRVITQGPCFLHGKGEVMVPCSLSWGLDAASGVVGGKQMATNPSVFMVIAVCTPLCSVALWTTSKISH